MPVLSGDGARHRRDIALQHLRRPPPAQFATLDRPGAHHTGYYANHDRERVLGLIEDPYPFVLDVHGHYGDCDGASKHDLAPGVASILKSKAPPGQADSCEHDYEC